jgi:hypothetical protein
MEKITVKTQEFLAYDPWGTPRILSRSGTFVTPAEESAVSPASTLQASNQSPKSTRPVGNSQYFGGFEQFRNRLISKKAS